KRAEIEKASGTVYESLTARNRVVRFETVEEKRNRVAKAEADLSATLAGLSRMVLAPAARSLNRKRLLIVPDGSLHYVPFAILPTTGESGTRAESPAPSREVVNLPSASALALLRKEFAGRAAAAKGVAIFADPVFDKEDERFKAISSGSKNFPKPLSASV